MFSVSEVGAETKFDKNICATNQSEKNVFASVKSFSLNPSLEKLNYPAGLASGMTFRSINGLSLFILSLLFQLAHIGCHSLTHTILLLIIPRSHSLTGPVVVVILS